MDLYIENKITNGSCVVRKRKRNNRSSSDEENSIANVVHFTATVSKVCIGIEKSIMQYILLQAFGFDATDSKIKRETNVILYHIQLLTISFLSLFYDMLIYSKEITVASIEKILLGHVI